MVLLELQIYPMDKGEKLTAHVARCLDVIDKSGITYLMNPMGTILEGEWDEVMAVASDCYKALEIDCNRIAVNMKVDYRAGKESRLKSKIETVEATLGRGLVK